MNESQAAAEGQSTKQKEQVTTAVHDEDDSGKNTSPTMLSILSALQASVTSSIKVTVLTFLVKNRTKKLSGESIFCEYAKKRLVKFRTRSRPRP